jgi:hypothetical protein
MAIEDPDELDRVDQEIRINELRCRAEELCGGEMTSSENPDSPPGIIESFWQHVVNYETAPLTSNFRQLQEAGVDMPAPEEMNDEELTAKLWEVIHQLAKLRVFLYQTNHLSDRELYTHLWSQSLHEAHPDMPMDEDSSWTIDILGGCSEEDIELQMKYYADEQSRADWMKSFPEYEMPAHEDPPYDRDRHLPDCGY